MWELRSRTRRGIAAYPATPVVYRRPVLRAVSGAIFAAMALGLVWAVLHPDSTDPLTASEWPLPVLLVAMIGPVYVYASSSLVVDTTHVHLLNPFRRVDIPLGHVLDVTPGSGLSIRTSYDTFSAWAVEAGNLQLVTGSLRTQRDLAGVIRRAAAEAQNADEPSVRYRWAAPDAFCLCGLLLGVLASVILLATGG